MFWAVVPAFNEENRVTAALDTALAGGSDGVLVVENGSRDSTLDQCMAHPSSKIHVVTLPAPLGPDVPRAVGAMIALQAGARGVLFLDGDLTGSLEKAVHSLWQRLQNDQADLALSRIYPEHGPGSAGMILDFRRRLNRELQIDSSFGAASPSHGPCAVSSKLIRQIPIQFLAVPPLMLAYAVHHDFRVALADRFHHRKLQSAKRDPNHSKRMTHTLIGDSVSALQWYRSNNTHRRWGGNLYLGYHPRRRWDILSQCEMLFSR